MSNDQILIIVPTYNEIENIEKLYFGLKKLGTNFNILFIDDNSPDGSGKWIDGLTKRDANVRIIHRSHKMGIGSAHLEGIKFAYAQQYKTIITMDCDFSHSPEYIKEFLCFRDQYDLVVGSRFIASNCLPNWSFFRKFLTYLGRFLTKTVLNIPYDATGAYRLYRIDRIDSRLFELATSPGYSFFFESMFIFTVNKIRIKEVPIVLPARCAGQTKMKVRDMYKSMLVLFSTYFKYLINKDSMIKKVETLPHSYVAKKKCKR